MGAPVLKRSAAETSLIEAYEKGRDELPGSGSPWLASLRKDSAVKFAGKGLPHKRIEEWKYTDLRSALSDVPPLATPPHKNKELKLGSDINIGFGSVDRHVAVFINGFFSEEFSNLGGLDSEVDLIPLEESIFRKPDWVSKNFCQISDGKDDALVALNTSLMAGGFALRVGTGIKLEKPIEFVFVSEGDKPSSVMARALIVIEEGAEASIFETHLGSRNPSHLNLVTEISIADKAKLSVSKVQFETANSAHLSTRFIQMAAGSNLADFTLNLGAELTRNQTHLRFEGEHAEADLSGSYILSDTAHADTTLVIDHKVPNCVSKELFKGVLDDKATGVFQGKIIVHDGAQHTDGQMMTQGLLLSEDAHFYTKPELEIYADDVQCAHGATSGQIDEELIFYLLSRGIPPKQAKAMIIQAFIAEALETVSSDEVQDVLVELVSERLSQMGELSDG